VTTGNRYTLAPMEWFTFPRATVFLIVALFVAMLIYAANLGMTGTMFDGFFSNLGGTPAAGATPGARIVATPTVRR
jgi:hypothetical protein